MGISEYLGLAASIGGLFICVFKIKSKKNLSFRVLGLTISVSLMLMILSIWLFKVSIISIIVVVVSMTAMLSALSIFAWSLRKNPKKKQGF